MSILNNINELYISSLKKRDRDTVDFLRYLKSEIKNKEIDKREELDDNEICSIIHKNIKKIEENIDIYKQQKREDLIKKSEKEIYILKSLLPEELSAQEIVDIIKDIIERENIPKEKKSMGIIMKKVLGKVGGRCSAKKISEIVQSILE